MFEGREWAGNKATSEALLSALRDVVKFELPEELYALLRYSNGGEGSLPVNPYSFCLDTTEEIIANVGFYGEQPDFADLLVIGGNGAGEIIAIDARDASLRSVIYIDMVAGMESAELIAHSFEAFLELIGQESTDA